MTFEHYAGVYKPPPGKAGYCMERRSDMLKNLFKATRFYPYSHGCILGVYAFCRKVGRPGRRTMMCCWKSFFSTS